MTSDQRPPDRELDGDLDPGAYIGHEPELEEETIPGGVKPADERIAAYGSQAGAEGEPDSSASEGAVGGTKPEDADAEGA